MDPKLIASIIMSLPSLYSSITTLIAGASSNEDVITKIASLSPRVADLVGWLGKTLFTSVQPQFQSAAAAISMFGQEFVKGAQMTLNIVSPLLGLPAPNLTVDGIPGPLTQAATTAVQNVLKTKDWKDLVVDGFYGFKTRDAVNAFLASVAK